MRPRQLDVWVGREAREFDRAFCGRRLGSDVRQSNGGSGGWERVVGATCPVAKGGLGSDVHGSSSFAQHSKTLRGQPLGRVRVRAGGNRRCGKRRGPGAARVRADARREGVCGSGRHGGLSSIGPKALHYVMNRRRSRERR